MHDKGCYFNYRSKCRATSYQTCENCRFRVSDEEYKATRQASFDRRMRLGMWPTLADVADMERGIIEGGEKYVSEY